MEHELDLWRIPRHRSCKELEGFYTGSLKDTVLHCRDLARPCKEFEGSCKHHERSGTGSLKDLTQNLTGSCKELESCILSYKDLV